MQPTKTMFQTPLDQLDHLLLRDSHCCCEAGTTWPSTTESARKPPLAQPAFHFESKSNRCSVSLDVQAPQGSGLGDGDPRDALGGRRGDGEVLQRPPEVARRVGVGHPLGVDVHAAVDLHVVGVLPQAGHVGVEAHVEGDVVRARLEEQRIALGAELVGLHLREDAGGGALDVRGRHARVEDVDVRAEDGGVRRGDGAGEDGTRDDCAQACQGGQGKSVDRMFLIMAGALEVKWDSLIIPRETRRSSRAGSRVGAERA